MYRFMSFINEKHNQNYNDYSALYQWSIDNIPAFWQAMWEFADIRASKTYNQVVDDLTKMPGAKWFTGCRLNFAENLLRYRDDQTALIFRGENIERRTLTYGQLFKEVTHVADALKSFGVQTGDRVVGFMPNMPETIVAMLAAAALGATWASCSPDFGIKGVLDRFGQIKPKVLFAGNGYWFKGKKLDSLERIATIVRELPTLEKLVIVPYTDKSVDLGGLPNAILYDDLRPSTTASDLSFEQLPFEHPHYIMFTSGTTGLPKCMVQSAGGVLIQQLKDLVLHSDLKREDTIFYFTTCGWMMWNWLTTSLAAGATLVLYDGNAFHPNPGALWKMGEEEKISIFGTSAGYIAALQNSGISPRKDYDLTPLRTILSTGSPLSVDGFDYIYQKVKEDVLLGSITGGSDLNGVLAGANPMGPVYAGEIQARSLGMKVEVFDDEGNSMIGKVGELVVTAPFPSMPLYFWDDPDGEKYHSAYFDVYPNVWRHGDFIELNEHGGVVVHGRSDATLNPGGVRIGTAEIYRQVEQLEEIQDSLVIGHPWKKDVRVVLFVQMAEGKELTEQIRNKIRSQIRTNASPRHVPAKIIAVPAIPYTLNMKKVELAVRKVVQGEEVKNKDALANPEVLDYYANLKELKEE